MQGITVALFPQGIKFFVESLFAPNGEIAKTISGAALADFQVTVPQDIFFTTGQNEAADCSNINIQFSNGSISNFTPIFQSLQQEKEGVFQLIFSSDAFNANYSWLESYTRQNQTYEQSDNPDDPGEWVNDGNSYPVSTPFPYSAGIGSLATNSNLTFTFDSSKNLWELPVTSITAVASNPSANIPGNSILQDQDQPGCVQSHVDSATEASIDRGTDFSKSITTAFGGYLTSIPASGQLYQGPNGTITFAFGLGDSPLTFPNDIGLSVGVTGISTYTPPGQSTPQQYPGTPPTGLPVPSTAPLCLFGGIPASEAANFDAGDIEAIKTDFATYSVPANAPTQPPQYPLTNPTVTVIVAGSEWLVVDSNNMQYQVKLINNGTIDQLQVFYNYHLQMYVSDYVLNGLYWAFFMAGQLSTTVTPATFPDDPDVLKVKTYINSIPSLKPYSTRAMNAIVSAKTAPILSFQTIYIFTNNGPNSAMAKLQNSLPTDIFNDISGLANNAYTNTTDVEADLTGSGVPNNYFSKIENAIAMMGVVVTHDILFKMVIEDAPLINGELPYFQFDVNRIDVLPEAGLVLGVSNQAGSQAQTLQFTFVEVSASATFESSNIPKFDGQGFANNWGIIGDKPYDDLQTEVGKAGAPLPIMQGFSFLFENALLNIEQNATCGFVSICANVEFKG